MAQSRRRRMYGYPSHEQARVASAWIHWDSQTALACQAVGSHAIFLRNAIAMASAVSAKAAQEKNVEDRLPGSGHGTSVYIPTAMTSQRYQQVTKPVSTSLEGRAT